MNQIFGYQTLPEDKGRNVFKLSDTEEIVSSADEKIAIPQLRLFAQPNTSIHSCHSTKYRAYSYVWGIPVHPDIPAKDIPEWCIKVISEKDYDRFKELIGTFIIIVDEPHLKKVTFVNDILGIRPFFHGTFQGRMVFGSNVWSMQGAGMSAGNIDYDSVSAWIVYGYNSTDGSLFSDLQRLTPGAVTTITDGKYAEFQYARFESDHKAPPIEQVSEEVHHIVSSTVKTLLANHNRFSLPLSGGFDSRYLLSLSLLNGNPSIECSTVSISEKERQVAHQIADMLGVSLKTYDINGSIWNFYEDPYHFMADGFPITKFVPYRIAQDYSGLPMMNGFMGDALIRGDSDKYQGKYETEWDENPVDVLQRKHTRINLRLLRKDIALKVMARSRPSMEKAVREGSILGKIMTWQDYYYTHRFYISNNFLQHIEFADALIPFYNWPLLSFKMKHAYKVFNLDTYCKIFEKHFPNLSGIPRSSDLQSAKKKTPGIAKCTKQWAREIIPTLLFKADLSLLQKSLSIPYSIAAVSGLHRAESSVFDLKRLYLLERKTKDTGLNFDWKSL